MLRAYSAIPQLFLRGRPLQHAEAFFAYQQVVSVAACRVDKPLDQRLVKQASEMVRDTHPNLNHTLHLDYFSPSALRFVPKPVMPIDFTMTEKHERDDLSWQSMMCDEMNTPFLVGGKGVPLWRLRMILTPNSTDLILPISHAIVDALGMTVFFTDLLRYYSKLARGEKVEIVPRKEVPPAVERVLPGSSTNRGGLLGTIGEFASKFAVSSMKLKLPLNRNVYGEDAKLRSVARDLPYECIFRSGSAEGMRRVKESCKSHSVTIGSYLNAALMFAVGAEQCRNGQNCSPYSLGYSVNLRPFIGTKLEDMDLISGYSAVSINLKDEQTFWQVASEANRKVSAELKSRRVTSPLVIWGLERFSAQRNSSDPFWGKIPFRKTGDVGFSNVGRLQQTEFECGNIVEFYETLNNALIGPCHFLALTSTDRFFCSWAFDPNVTTKEMAQVLLKRFLHLIENPPADTLTFKDFRK